MLSIKSLFGLLFVTIGSCTIALMILNIHATQLRESSHKKKDQLYDFYTLSQELKQSSDHLTKFARAYVSTGDEQWLQLFNHVLAVRSGFVSLPEGNDYDYWDTVAHVFPSSIGPPFDSGQDLLLRLRNTGIAETEYLSMKKAFLLSEKLVELEREAFEIVEKATYRPIEHESHAFHMELRKAQNILYSDQYFSEKSAIMKAIGEAHHKIVARISTDIEYAESLEQEIQNYHTATVIILMIAILISFSLMWHLYIKPISVLLNNVVTQVKSKNYSFKIQQKAYAELQQFIDSLNLVLERITDQLDFKTLEKDFSILLRTSPTTEVLCQEIAYFFLKRFDLQFISVYILNDNKLNNITSIGLDIEAKSLLSANGDNHYTILNKGECLALKDLNGSYKVTHIGGYIEINEILYFPLQVNGQPIALLEMGTTTSLSKRDDLRIKKLMDDLAVSIKLSLNAERQRTAEQKVLEQSQLNQQVLDATPNPMYCLSPQGEYLTINAKFTEFLQLDESGIIHNKPSILFSNQPNVVAAFVEHHDRLINSAGFSEYQLHIKDGNHTERSILIREASFTNNSGEILGIVGIMMDLTEQKQIEAALREAKENADAISKAKGSFLANMSHEIRTPMNAILGMAHLTLNTDLTELQKRYINNINESAKNLLGIINDILDFSKIESGKLEIEAIPFQLDDVFDNVTNVISFKANEKNLEFIIDIAPDVPTSLIGDPLRLGQVLVNLCGNSVKFTQYGEIVVSVSLIERNKENVTLNFTVKDTGIGIEDSKVQGLFTAFTQADGSTTREFGGTGLGLSITKQLVELMSGHIHVTSTVGKGSDFTFQIICGLQADNDFAQPSKPVPSSTLSALVIDDNQSVLQVMKSILDNLQLRTQITHSSHLAIDMIQRESFDFIFVDWNMPNMNGLDLIKHCQALDLIKQTKVILVTAYGRELALSEQENQLIDTVIFKPVNASSVHDSIMNSLGYSPTSSSSEKHPIVPPSFNGKRLLLVEDNQINQEVAMGILEGTGIEIITADNGLEALSKINESTFDIVLMDIQMPEMDGITATKKIRQTFNSSRLPIIAMTANAMQSDEQECKQAGMNGHIAKPIDIEKLYATLVTYLSSNQQIENPDKLESASQTDLSPQADLPLLTGVDIEKAVANLGGNANNYLTILHRFLEGLETELIDLKEQVQAQDWDSAARTAHTLKGTSGNLLVSELYRVSIDIEQSIHKNRENVLLSIEEFSAIKEKLHQELNQWTDLNEKNLTLTDKTLSPNQWYSQLHDKLHQYDPTAIDSFQTISDDLKWNDNQIDALKIAIEQFDFQKAIELLEQYPKP